MVRTHVLSAEDMWFAMQDNARSHLAFQVGLGVTQELLRNDTPQHRRQSSRIIQAILSQRADMTRAGTLYTFDEADKPLLTGKLDLAKLGITEQVLRGAQDRADAKALAAQSAAEGRATGLTTVSVAEAQHTGKGVNGYAVGAQVG